MATYIKGVTDYIPVLEPFKPDYKFLSDVLTVRQDRYDSNFKTLNNLYSKVVHAPLSREDNGETREQYGNKLSNGLKQVSGIDLSLQQNVDIAKGLFKPFFEDKSIVKDMAFTKMYSKEMQNVNNYMTSKSEKERDRYWQVGVQDLKYQMDDFKSGTKEAALSQGMPTYVENPNIYERSFEALKDSELSIKQTTLEGDWIITTKNGTALTRQVVGYQYEEDGHTLKLHKDTKQPIPIYRNPAAEYLKNTVMKDPIVMRGLLTEAKVVSRQFSENEENIHKYGSIENAKKAWADEILSTQTNKDIVELSEKESELKKESIAARNWENYKKTHKIIPGTPEEEALMLSQFNRRLAQENRDAVKSRVVNQKAPTSDIDGLMNKAYSAYMASVMGPKMSEAATAYSQVDAEQTFEANPFKKMEHQHRYDLNRMAVQNQYDLNKIALKATYDLELAKFKNQQENQNNDILGIGTGGVLTEPGGADISGSLTGYDYDGDGDIDDDEIAHVNVLEENKDAIVELGNMVTNREISFMEKMYELLPADMHEVGGYKGGGEISYSYFDETSGETTQKTASLSTAWKDLTTTNSTNRVEFDRILKNVGDKYTNMIKTSDGSNIHYDLSKLNYSPQEASLVHDHYKSILEGRNRINQKVEGMNKVYHQVHDYAMEKDKQMNNSTTYQGQENSIPPVLLTQGEIDMLRSGVPWHKVKYASDNGNLEEANVDGTGAAIRRFVTKEEYSSIYADMNSLSDADITTLYKYDDRNNPILTREYGVFDDDEYIAERYWDYKKPQKAKTYNLNHGKDALILGAGTVHQEASSGKWAFDRSSAIEDGEEYYDAVLSNMNAIMAKEDAPEMGLTYNVRGQMIGQPEEGVGEAGYTIYTTTYDPASKTQVAINQLKSIVQATSNIPAQTDGYTFSIGHNFTETTDDIKEMKYNQLSKTIYKKTIEDINTGKLDKTDGRPYISTSYIEKASGPDQETDVAAYNISFGMEYSKIYKDLFVDDSGDLDKAAFAKFQKEGITITIPQDMDNNPYKSANQLLSFTDLAIKENGSYSSLPIANGGEYKIYQNSQGQYIQETTTYLFNKETGGVPANDIVSIVLDVDASQLDNLVVNMDQHLVNLSKENNNKKTLWVRKNGNQVPVEQN